MWSCLDGAELVPGVEEEVLQKIPRIMKLVLFDWVNFAGGLADGGEKYGSDVPANDFVDVV